MYREHIKDNSEGGVPRPQKSLKMKKMRKNFGY